MGGMMAMGGGGGTPGGGGMMGGMPGMGMGMPAASGMAPPGNPNEPSSIRFNDQIFVTSPEGTKVAVLRIGAPKARSLTLSNSKESRFKVLPVSDGRLLAVQIEGAGIKRIAVMMDGVWYPRSEERRVGKEC